MVSLPNTKNRDAWPQFSNFCSRYSKTFLRISFKPWLKPITFTVYEWHEILLSWIKSDLSIYSLSLFNTFIKDSTFQTFTEKSFIDVMNYFCSAPALILTLRLDEHGENILANCECLWLRCNKDFFSENCPLEEITTWWCLVSWRMSLATSLAQTTMVTIQGKQEHKLHWSYQQDMS